VTARATAPRLSRNSKTASMSHPRFHLHVTPMHAFWLNQVERFFGLLTQRALQR
jgi:hypothetical protein